MTTRTTESIVAEIAALAVAMCRQSIIEGQFGQSAVSTGALESSVLEHWPLWIESAAKELATNEVAATVTEESPTRSLGEILHGVSEEPVTVKPTGPVTPATIYSTLADRISVLEQRIGKLHELLIRHRHQMDPVAGYRTGQTEYMEGLLDLDTAPATWHWTVSTSHNRAPIEQPL